MILPEKLLRTPSIQVSIGTDGRRPAQVALHSQLDLGGGGDFPARHLGLVWLSISAIERGAVLGLDPQAINRRTLERLMHQHTSAPLANSASFGL